MCVIVLVVEALPPLPDCVFEPVLLLPEWVFVELAVPVVFPPVSPPRAPLPPWVEEPLLTSPPLPPLPVAPEFPEPAGDDADDFEPLLELP